MSEGKYKTSSKIHIDGDKIKSRREELGLTQLYVASIVGVTTDTISRWENKKYTNIKKENALKLAKALEIDISEIIKQENKTEETKKIEPEDTINYEKIKNNTNDKEIIQKKFIINKQLLILILITLLVIIFYGIFSLYYKQRTSIPNIKVQRILPHYSAPGEKFPVIIKIKIRGSNPSSIIVREHFSHFCIFIRSIPHCITKKRNELVWILPVNKKSITIVYFLKVKTNVSIGKKLKFSGLIIMKKGHYKQSIRGNSYIIVKYVHWADMNGDMKIDDQEILTVFDELQGIKGLNHDKKEIEKLWAAGEYHWDAKTHKFLPNK